ncbi:AAA family ATPase [Streptomyces sp. WP-1]|uniref:AAA family ATPase n=1 Tax=Streptomyces sp. WP-1 TaxID=3041497 RepID=UPI002647662F|nr:AAA family ATPase [Streptomyces sp. WP-1]WKE70502.1 AAA family ATPase [Streptomyces sp. WP-1]
MAFIVPERVSKAAKAIAAVGRSRSDADVARLLVVKRMGLIPGQSIVITNQDAVNICDELYGVPGREPNAWYEPFSGDWRKQQGNGGWPVGSIKTQLERPNKNMRTILDGQKDGANIVVSMREADVYHESLATEFKCKRFPLEEAIIWFFRGRADLPEGQEVDVSSLVDEFTDFFHLSPTERKKLFTDPAPGLSVAVTTIESEQSLGLLLPSPQPPKDRVPANPVERETQDDGFEWTKELSDRTFENADVRSLVETVKTLADARDLVLPDEDSLIERCVVALLSGHLVLQGPPGTGKTTLARLLAEAFSADTVMTTATADWTTYEVIGGLRPSHDGTLEPVLGAVPKTALSCAEKMRASAISSVTTMHEGDADEMDARWLIIDELNRADIDRAIGGLYTVLSSTDGRHLRSTPIDLWFEKDSRRRLLWVPGRFRIIGTMNDVDTSFVNSLSQGLTRRFQFVYLGVPNIDQIDAEIELCQRQAQSWLEAQYPGLASSSDDAGSEKVLGSIGKKMRDVFTWLRFGDQKSGSSSVASWPVGTAQAVDLWKAVLLTLSSGPDIKEEALVRAFDASFADRIIPQMGTLRASHIALIQEYFDSEQDSLRETRRAIRHLRNTQSVR